jgi:hypothetical protein
VESQTRDFHNVQEVAWMSTELMDIRNERDPKKGKAPTNNKTTISLTDKAAFCILALLYIKGYFLCCTFPCTFYNSSASYSLTEPPTIWHSSIWCYRERDYKKDS